MKQINKFKEYKFHIHCPSNSLKNGGMETLHQLGRHLKKNNFSVSLNFYPNINYNQIPTKLLKYNLTYEKFNDEVNTFHIIPEIDTIRTKLIKKGKCIIYWLSVDGYFRKNLDKPFWKNWNYYRKSMKKRVFFHKLKKFHHLANSHYAKLFLEKKKMKSQILKGYISNYYSSKIGFKKKKDVILYNPIKDKLHYKEVKKIIPEYEFRPLSNLSQTDLKDNYLESKIFMDLGTHPGRERMPREAVSMGCVLILANRGSVENIYDVPIKDLYKINLDNKDCYFKIANLIKNICKNYDNHIENFIDYKKKISFRNEYKLFNKSVKTYFNSICDL